VGWWWWGGLSKNLVKPWAYKNNKKNEIKGIFAMP